MEITGIASGIKKTVTVKEIEEGDFKLLTKKRFSFNWKLFKQTTNIYKLQIAGGEDILGVMNCIDAAVEKRIEIKLLACSVENVGKHKIYDGVTGCLIAYACMIAKKEYGFLACVSLVPKTVLKAHYINKYQMTDAGWQLYLEGDDLNSMIKKYLL